jgi:hypothetical protein
VDQCPLRLLRLVIEVDVLDLADLVAFGVDQIRADQGLDVLEG